MNRMLGWALQTGRQFRTAESADTGPASPWTLRFASGYLVTMRPYLLFVSGFTGLLGMALAPAFPAGAGVLLTLAFFLAYGFGQALTDCFQTDTDSLSAPYRPLVRGEIRPMDVFVMSLAGLVGCGWILIAHHPANLVLAVLEIAGLLTYTWMKRRWWGGPPHNAWIVALLVVMGTLAASGAAGSSVVLDSRTVWAAAAAFFGYSAFVISGYHKDVEADRGTGYHTLPVRFGRRVSALVCDGVVLAAVVSSAFLIGRASSLGSVSGLPAIAFFAAGALAYLRAQLRLHRSRTDADAHQAIAPVVHGYLLILAAGITAHRPAWTPILVGLYLLFNLALRARPMKAQI